MKDFNSEELKSILHVTAGFKSMQSVNEKLKEVIAEKEEVESLSFEDDDCVSCKL